MKILVCGGRYYCDKDKVFDVLSQQNIFTEIKIIIQGGANGADSLAKEWAIKNNVNYKTFPAEWEKYGNSAGHIRNQQMIDEGKPNLIIAFPGGNGTKNMIKLATKAGISIRKVL